MEVTTSHKRAVQLHNLRVVKYHANYRPVQFALLRQSYERSYERFIMVYFFFVFFSFFFLLTSVSFGNGKIYHRDLLPVSREEYYETPLLRYAKHRKFQADARTRTYQIGAKVFPLFREALSWTKLSAWWNEMSVIWWVMVKRDELRVYVKYIMMMRTNLNIKRFFETLILFLILFGESLQQIQQTFCIGLINNILILMDNIYWLTW